LTQAGQCRTLNMVRTVLFFSLVLDFYCSCASVYWTIHCLLLLSASDADRYVPLMSRPVPALPFPVPST